MTTTELITRFDELWEEISKNLSKGTKRAVRKKTKRLLEHPGRVKGVKIEGVIGKALYLTAKRVYQAKGMKPKTQKEIADLVGVSAATISKRTNF